MYPRVPWKVRGLLYAVQRNNFWQVFAYKINSKEILFFSFATAQYLQFFCDRIFFVDFVERVDKNV